MAGVWGFLRSVASAYASVLFGVSPVAGAVLMAITLLRPDVGLGGLVATTAATAAARLLGYRVDAVSRGYYGMNALLVGLAVMQGRGPLTVSLVVLLTLAGVASALLTAVLGDHLHRQLNLPVLALPFVILGTLLPPALQALGLPAPTSTAVVTPWEPLLPPPLDIVARSVSSLFFQEGALAGLAILAVALSISRIGAVAMVGGVLVAVGMGAIMGAPAAEPVVRAMAYNAALTALAVSAFLFVPGRVASIAGIFAAALAAWMSVTLAAILGRLDLPILAWPFVLVTLLVTRGLHLRAPDRPPFPHPLPGLSPEANLDHATSLRGRFGIPGPPRLLLPVEGSWVVSQGVGGGPTHQGPWAHAWDLEKADERRFPFRGDGSRNEDYLCFGAAVLAPACGTVAAVVDGVPDGRPGDIDTARPWGNAVVIQHGPDLYSVLAHLRLGSVAVVAGQVVAPAQVVGACGSSGRSPRPHLHFQAQRSPELGAASIPCRVEHYLTQDDDGGARYVYSGVPREGDRLGRTAPALAWHAEALAASLAPGAVLHLDGGSAGPVTLRSEISLFGERSLLDLDREDRLYFTLAHGDLAFTAHTGRGLTPLRALMLALPRLPWAAAARFRYDDRPPAAAILPGAVRLVHDTMRFLADPVEVASTSESWLDGDARRVRTEIRAGLRGLARRRYVGEVVLTVEGLSELVLSGDGGAPLMRLRRMAPAPPIPID